jgi:hypothetical protein
MLSPDGKRFACFRCREVKPLQTSGGTGYGADGNGNLICYSCCADIDREDMRRTGKATLYLTAGADGTADVTNWPGTLRFRTGPVRRGRHNMAGTRYDVWFTGPDGKEWHGVQYGENTQIVHCKRVKG